MAATNIRETLEMNRLIMEEEDRRKKLRVKRSIRVHYRAAERPQAQSQQKSPTTPFLNKWDDTYRRRRRRNRHLIPYILPESLIDAVFMALEQTVARAVSQILK